MQSRQQLLDMRAEILEHKAALPDIPEIAQDSELLNTLNQYFTTELGIIDIALEWQDRKQAIAAAQRR